MALLLAVLSPAFAADYYFEVPEQAIDVFIESDGTLTIEYYYLFKNAPGAHVIDYVDIGMPGSSKYSLNDVSATVNDKPITNIEDSDYVDGIALGLGSDAIPAGATGIVYMRVENVRGQFYFASVDEEEEYTSMRFQPNYFESNFVGGSSQMEVNIYLPLALATRSRIISRPRIGPARKHRIPKSMQKAASTTNGTPMRHPPLANMSLGWPFLPATSRLRRSTPNKPSLTTPLMFGARSFRSPAAAVLPAFLAS